MSKFGSLQWCLQLTDEEWTAFFASVGKQGGEILKVSNLGRSASWLPTDYSRSLQSHMNTVSNYPDASVYQKYRVWRITFKSILPCLQALQSYGTDEVPPKYSYNLRKVFPILKTWKMRQIERVAKQERTEGTILKELQSNFVETVAPLQKLPSGLLKPFEEIMVLHTTASQLQLTAEDAYFVEQVKEDYLPTIALASVRIQTASEDAQAEAKKNFTEQLNLIQKRLETIIRDAEKKILAEVRAQTLFLEASNKKELTA